MIDRRLAAPARIAAGVLLGLAAGCQSHIGISKLPKAPVSFRVGWPTEPPPPLIKPAVEAALGRGPDPAGATDETWWEALRYYAARRDLLVRPSEALCAASVAWRYLEAAPRTGKERERKLALEVYNEAVEGLLEAWPREKDGDLADGLVEEWEGSVPLRVDWAESDYPKGYFEDWTPASTFDVVGFLRRYAVAGIGKPMVGFRKNLERLPVEKYYPLGGIVRPLTAIVVARAGHPPRLILKEACEHPAAGHGLGNEALADDTTAAMARLIETDEVLSRYVFGFEGDIKREVQPNLVMLEPYSPDRIPVVLVHGLRSSPLIWRDLGNEILGDPYLRAHVQLWIYFYPTNVPYLISALDLRQRLDEARKFFGGDHPPPALDDMVMIGHSMGGLVCRSLVTNSGDVLWKAMLRHPEQLKRAKKTAPAGIEEFRRFLEFKAVPYVHRVVFIATPHRGSDLADSWIGKYVSVRIEEPEELRMAWKKALKEVGLSPFVTDLVSKNQVTSVRVLSPRDPVLRALAALPIAPGVHYHTITGDRGKGDGPDASDGVVTYASAHLAGADSEFVVHADHSMTDNPDCIAEIIRILRVHIAAFNP